MSLSITQEFLRFLTPGVVEDLEKAAGSNKNWLNLAKTLKFSRNAVYIGVAIAIIAGVGAALSGFGTIPMLIFTAVVITSVIITAIALKKMHSQILKFQKI